MSASHEWTEWCLTPRGWERGRQREDFRGLLGERPKDTVLVHVYDEGRGNYRSSSRSSVERERLADDERINKLLSVFRDPPSSL